MGPLVAQALHPGSSSAMKQFQHKCNPKNKTRCRKGKWASRAKAMPTVLPVCKGLVVVPPFCLCLGRSPVEMIVFV